MRSASIDILQTRGFRGLYSGLSPTLVEIIPYAGLQFGTYDTFKRWAMVKFQSLNLRCQFYLVDINIPCMYWMSFRCCETMLWSYIV
jgi:hypothetical protein